LPVTVVLPGIELDRVTKRCALPAVNNAHRSRQVNVNFRVFWKPLVCCVGEVYVVSDRSDVWS
jgi:hypothetical protein